MLSPLKHHYTRYRPHQSIGDLTPTSRQAQSGNNLLTLHS